jgi:hypothetical protein
MVATPPIPPGVEEVRTVEELTLARVLEECLEAIERGETDLGKLAGRYPEAWDKIRPLIEIAQQLRRRRALSVPMSLQIREEFRERLLAHR